MTVDEIKEILELMREHELAEFELQRDGETLRLRKHSPTPWSGAMPAVPAVAYTAPVAAAPMAAPTQAGGEAAVLEPVTATNVGPSHWPSRDLSLHDAPADCSHGSNEFRCFDRFSNVGDIASQ